MIGNRIPATYDHSNIVNAQISPSTVHVKNTGLQRYFVRYLLQKIMSVYEWKMPETWDRDYFLYVLYCWGFISVINTDRFGIVPQGCSLRGYDVFYRPTNVVISNPVFRETYDLKIGKQCTLIKLMPDFGGCMDLVNYYADMLALCAETAATNIMNSKLSYVFRAADKTMAEGFKKMMDQISSGEPAVFIDKYLKNVDGSTGWETFAQDLRSNYIAGDVLSDMRKWEEKFDTEIGIPNANTEKKERLISDEVNANNFEVKSKAELWLESLKKGCEETNKLFGINLSVDFRKSLEEDPVQQSMKEGENDE